MNSRIVPGDILGFLLAHAKDDASGDGHDDPHTATADEERPGQFAPPELTRVSVHRAVTYYVHPTIRKYWPVLSPQVSLHGSLACRLRSKCCIPKTELWCINGADGTASKGCIYHSESPVRPLQSNTGFSFESPSNTVRSLSFM